MKKVYQTLFTDLDNEIYGNCFSACVASLIECDINEVPFYNDFVRLINDTPMNRFNVFIASKIAAFLEKKGFAIATNCGELTYPEECIDCYTVPDKDVNAAHAVIGKEGKIIFDPNPNNLQLGNLAGQFIIFDLERKEEFYSNKYFIWEHFSFSNCYK